MPPKARGAGVKKVRRKEKKNVAHGHAHIKSTFNNTIVSITDPAGTVISWASGSYFIRLILPDNTQTTQLIKK